MDDTDFYDPNETVREENSTNPDLSTEEPKGAFFYDENDDDQGEYHDSNASSPGSSITDAQQTEPDTPEVRLSDSTPGGDVTTSLSLLTTEKNSDQPQVRADL